MLLLLPEHMGLPISTLPYALGHLLAGLKVAETGHQKRIPQVGLDEPGG